MEISFIYHTLSVMLKIIVLFLVFVSSLSSVSALGEGNRIELAITPIKKELQIAPGGSATGSVTLYNNSSEPYVSMMGSEDCTSSNQYGTPDCLLAASGAIDPALLSTWIVFSNTGTFTIAPKSSYTMNYTVRVPSTTQPGGYYAGIIFKNMTAPIATSGTVGINRRIQSLILITISGDMIVDPEFGSIQIDTSGGGEGVRGGVNTDSLNLFRFNQTGSIIEQLGQKGSKFMMIFTDPSTQEAVINYINPFWETPQLKSAGPDPRITLGNTISGTTDSDINTASDLSGNLIPIFSLAIPVENKGTIHIIPTGRITLHELDGTQLLNVGKEFIKNENGAVISEKVVDYLTINAEGGALLPQANRLYGINWFGFGRESINPDRSISVLFENPGVYYARVARDDSGYIKPWEKLVQVHTVKHLIARVNLSYMNPVTRKLVERNQDIPVTVEYDEIVKTWNTGLIFVGTIGILLFWWITIWRRRRYHYNDHNTLIGEAGSDEIAVLERARSIIFAKEATRAAKISTAITNKTIPKKLTPKTVDTSRIAPVIPSALIKKTAIKKPLAIEKVVSVKKTVAKKTSTTISKEA